MCCTYLSYSIWTKNAFENTKSLIGSSEMDGFLTQRNENYLLFSVDIGTTKALYTFYKYSFSRWFQLMFAKIP